MVPLIGAEYGGIFCLFLGNDLIDLGEGEVSPAALSE
jgi:hypothetical protein